MDAASTLAPRRLMFRVVRDEASIPMAALGFGDPDRPLDVVFLHANGFNAMTYRSVLAPLAGSMGILAVDLQGHGRSPRREAAAGRLNWFGFRDDLIALLETIGPAPVILAGHSLGATVSALVAGARPDRCRGLALFEPVVAPRPVAEHLAASLKEPLSNIPHAVAARRRRRRFPSRAAVMDSYRGRGAFRTWPEAVLADYIAEGFRDWPDGEVELICDPDWEASNYAAQGQDPWAALDRARVATTILRAQTGSTCQILTAEPFIAANPRLSVETVAGTTHFLPFERPERVRETLADLVRETGPSD